MTKIKRHKLDLRPNYKKLFKKPPLLVSKDFSVWVNNNDLHNLTRFGVIVAKKYIKKAVLRNKAKRIAKEIFKKHKILFVNQDLVLLVKKFTLKAYIDLWRTKLTGVFNWINHFTKNSSV